MKSFKSLEEARVYTVKHPDETVVCYGSCGVWYLRNGRLVGDGNDDFAMA